MKIGKYCGAGLAIGATLYVLLSAKFVPRTEWDKHLEFYNGKTAVADAVDSTLMQTNRQLLVEVRGLREDLKEQQRLWQEINARLIRLEVKNP